jgi:hypothetical protein
LSAGRFRKRLLIFKRPDVDSYFFEVLPSLLRLRAKPRHLVSGHRDGKRLKLFHRLKVTGVKRRQRLKAHLLRR